MESTKITTEAFSNDVQIKVEPEFILNLSKQTKDTSCSSKLSKYVEKQREPITGKLYFISNSLVIVILYLL